MSSLKLPDLNQYVVHKLFEYLERGYLYFCVRNVCQAMKQHVDSFITLTAKFLLAESLYFDRLNYLKSQNFASILYIFKQRSRPYLLHRNITPAIPSPKLTNESNEYVTWADCIGTFGGIIKGKIIVGYYCNERIIN